MDDQNENLIQTCSLFKANIDFDLYADVTKSSVKCVKLLLNFARNIFKNHMALNVEKLLEKGILIV